MTFLTTLTRAVRTARVRTLTPRALSALAAMALALLPTVVARAQQPAAGHVDGTSPDAQRLEAQLFDAMRIDPTAEPAKAQAAYEQVRVEAERLGLRREIASALRGLATVEAAQERREQAKALLERALALYRQVGDELGQARAERGLAVMLTASERDAEGRRLLYHAREVFARLGERNDLAITYLNIVYATETPKRDSEVEEALAAARASSLSWIECAIQHSAGDGLFSAGEYAAAYARLTDALACYERTDKVGDKGRVLVSLGRVERAHGQDERALAFYQQAYALQTKAHDEPAAIQSLNAIAVAYHRMGRTDDALQRYAEGLARARRIDSERIIAFMTGNLGGCYLDRGEYAKALDLLQQALAIEKNNGLRAYRQWQIAGALEGLDRFDDAWTSINEAVTLGRGGQLDVLMRILADRAYIAQRTNHLDAADADMREAIGLVEELRHKTLAQDFMKRGFSESTQEVLGSAVGMRALRGDMRGALEIAEEARARAFLDLLASRGAEPAVVGMVASSDAVAPYRSAPPALELESRRSVDAPNADEMIATARRLRSTLLVYWVGQRATYAWVIAPAGQISSTTIAVDSNRLAELARSTTALLKGGNAAALTMLNASQTKPWRELYQILIKPVRKHLPTAPNSLLTVIPHGPLFQISFAALQDEDGKYLIESYRLHYTPSVGVLAYTGQSRHRIGDASAKALLVGDPTPPASDPGDEALSDLPWARREVTEIGAAIGIRHARVMTGREATERKVREEIEHASLLHLATHGVIRQSESMSSFLALARADDDRPTPTSQARTPMDPRTDGKLTADEVYGLRLRADLVVLSACDTALGPMTGDGVIGFTRAFLYAGARSVIATEWNVPDRTGYELMRRFYRFRRVSSNTSDALRSAQISVLAALRKGALRVGEAGEQVALRENPLFWAGFVLVGEP